MLRQPCHHLVLKLLVNFKFLNLLVDSCEVELGEHQKFLLQLFNVECLHLVQHLLNRFKAQVLQDVRDLLKVLFNRLLLRLVYNRRQNISENTELIKVPHFNSDVKSQTRLRAIELGQDGDALEAVAEELREVVVEVAVHEDQIVFEVVRELIQVEEYLLEVLLDQGDQTDQLDIAQAAHDEVRC